MVVKVNRSAAVVKGGRRFSFSALSVVGNREGLVGYGFGKARQVPSAIEKAAKDGRKHLQRVPRTVGSGRIHTSAVTVAVLPEADEVDVQIDEKDLKIDVYRSSGCDRPTLTDL